MTDSTPILNDNSFRRFCTLVLAVLSLAAIGHADDAFQRDVRPYFEQHCFDCHGSETQEADRRFDLFTGAIATRESVDLWTDVLDQLNRGDMPPEDRPRPDNDETQKVIDWLRDTLIDAESRLSGPEPNLRRLNRREYNFTVRDLLGIDVTYDPSRTFPPDEVEHGFDTAAVALVYSPSTMQEALAAARDAIDRAIDFGDRPEVIVRQLAVAENAKPAYYHAEAGYLMLATGSEDGFQRFTPRQRGGWRPFERGEYLIRIRATGMFSDYQGPGEIDGPVQMHVRVGPGGEGTGRPRRSITVFDLPDDEPQTYEIRTRFETGDVPIISFPNGHDGSLKNLVRQRFGREARSDRRTLYPNWDAPHVRVFEVEVEGPLTDVWPPASHSMLIGDHHRAGVDSVRRILEEFLPRAFRRPTQASESEPFVQLYNHERSAGASHEAAIKTALTAVLCDPRFLYHSPLIAEGVDSEIVSDPTVDVYSLASRLSYFLWSSLPDQKLVAAAESGELSSPEELRRQADRMLLDPRSDAFIRSFAGQWLGINRLGEMPPDPKRFKAYYDHNLEPAMAAETYELFRHVLAENLSVATFLESDFTFANEALAEHYGLEGVRGDEMRRILLPADSVRGGLLGHASILTVTSNGTSTSPVIRGIWVLDNLLGARPAPPPPDVPAFEPDTRGTTTIREQLARHREIEACASCHSRMDPLGFALEQFDPIGGLRNRYENRSPIDTTGELPDGTRFDGAHSLKQVLSERHAVFARCLTEKLLIYATGRRPSVADQQGIDSLVETENAHEDVRFRDLLLDTISSPMFRER